jgi:hypothetical protein
LELEEAKKTAVAKGIADWKSLVKAPPKLDPQLKRIISEMYMAAANEVTKRQLFAVPTIKEVIKQYKEYMGE